MGLRPEHAGLMPLADKRDEARRALSAELETTISIAQHAAARGDVGTSAVLYEEISRRFREGGFVGEADAWASRANDARSADRIGKRRRRKGTGK